MLFEVLIPSELLVSVTIIRYALSLSATVSAAVVYAVVVPPEPVETLLQVEDPAGFICH